MNTPFLGSCCNCVGFTLGPRYIEFSSGYSYWHPDEHAFLWQICAVLPCAIVVCHTVLLTCVHKCVVCGFVTRWASWAYMAVSGIGKATEVHFAINLGQLCGPNVGGVYDGCSQTFAFLCYAGLELTNSGGPAIF